MANNIKELIATKIAGQGSMIDIGGALPTILGSLAERMSGEVDVTVKVHSYKKGEDSFEPDTEVSGSLYIKGFDAFGNVIPEQKGVYLKRFLDDFAVFRGMMQGLLWESQEKVNGHSYRLA